MCRAETAATRCEPPGPRSVAGLDAGASGGGWTDGTHRTTGVNIPHVDLFSAAQIKFFIRIINWWSVAQCTSSACWILSLLPARPGRLELNECVFSEICPPSRLSSGRRVSDHSLHTPSSQDVSNTLHTEPLEETGGEIISHTATLTGLTGWFQLCADVALINYSVKV